MSKRILGLDIGIASCGWGIIDIDGSIPKDGRIVAAGVRCFDAPLVDKTKEPKSAARRRARGQRRVIRRRRQRMNKVRQLLHENGILPNRGADALAEAAIRVSAGKQAPPVTPWTLRAAVHERKLSADELAIVLGHIARHRGFKSNSKAQGNANAADETSKMKKAMEATRESLAQYRSFGDMLANDPKFAERKRNREGDYSHTAKRSDLDDEVRAIFSSQRRFGNPAATETLQETFRDIAFSQRPLQDSEDLVGNCPFEAGEKRTARRAPSFELFRYLSRLNNLEIIVGRTARKLTEDELAIAAANFGATKTITFKALRKLLDIDPNARFSAPEKDKGGRDLDVAARTGGAAFGTKTLLDSLGAGAWKSLAKTPEKLDRIAEILSFREDLGRIREGLAEIGLDALIINKLADDAANGVFKDFTRAAHISALACRHIIPGLKEGLVYSDACARIGYDHAARATISIDQINSPVTRKAFTESIKQVRAIEREYGPIDIVHIELARAVGKSADERKRMTDGLETRTADKKRRREEAEEILGQKVTDDELLRYELAKEQQFKCIYSGDAIAPNGFAADDMRYQVDHILPWSRFGDDSFLNKTLCTTKANQEKRGQTPFEWFDASKEEKEWAEFTARVEGLVEVKGRKKRNYLLRNAADIEEKFKQRNLTDTQWIARILAEELKRQFPPRPEMQSRDGKDERRVFARPGAITSKLRRAWGLEALKKLDGERIEDDRHHAVDALVLAATTESLLQSITKEVQKRDSEGRADDIYHVSQPWPGFRMDVTRVIYGGDHDAGVFVSRAERRRARGKAHDATIKQIREIDGNRLVYERKDVMKLKESDLDLIPVPAPYGNIADPKKLRDELVETLRAWLALPPPERKKNPPRSPKGDIIRKVRVATKDKVAVEVNGGTVDRGDMARVDVFRKQNKKGKWEYYVVPIYPHQIATMAAPPNRAVNAGKPEEQWAVIDDSFDFMFSISIHDYLEVIKSNGEVIDGYFKGLDSEGGKVALAAHQNLDDKKRGIGTRTLSSFKKYKIDRLGRKSEVLRETRTWHGKACT